MFLLMNKPVDPYQCAVEKMLEAQRPVQRAVDASFTRREVVKILEAGCGSLSHLRFGDNAHVTGIDISNKALAANDSVHEKVLGDVQTYPLPQSEYDLVVCWNVLEHLPAPCKAIVNMANSLNRGGLLILAMPNLLSFEGLLTKFTPHWLHVLAYKYVFGYGHAGKDERPPFRTYLRLSISPPRLERFVSRLGLTIEYRRAYPDEPRMAVLKMTSRVLYFGFRMLGCACQLLSLGMIHRRNSAYLIILKKP